MQLGRLGFRSRYYVKSDNSSPVGNLALSLGNLSSMLRHSSIERSMLCLAV